jgi:tetratricopeptide (TPR) repeat protein
MQIHKSYILFILLISLPLYPSQKGNELSVIKLFNQAKRYCNTKNYEKGIKLYQKILKKVKDKVVIYIHISDCYQKNFQLDKAINTLKKAMKEYPRTKEIYDRLIKIYSFLRNENEIFKLYLRMSIVFPKNYKNYIILGNFYIRKRYYRKAYFYYKYAYNILKRKAGSKISLLYLYPKLFETSILSGDIKSAIKYGKEYITIQDKNNLSGFYHTYYKVLLEAGRYIEVLNHIARNNQDIPFSLYIRTKLVELSPNSLKKITINKDKKCKGDYICYGIKYLTQKEYQKAISSFKVAYKDPISNIEAIIGIAITYKIYGKTKLYKRYLRSAIEKSIMKQLIIQAQRLIHLYENDFGKDQYILYIKHILYYNTKHLKLSYAYYKEYNKIVSSTNKNDIYRKFYLLYLGYKAKIYDIGKIEDFIKTTNIPFFYDEFGKQLFKEKKYKLAVKYLLYANKYLPSDWTRLFYIGVCYERMKKYKLAIKYLRKSIMENPNSGTVLNYLGYTYAILGIKLDEAYDLVSKAIMLSPYTAEYWDSMGWIMYKKKDYSSALLWLQIANERIEVENRKNWEIYKHLYEIYKALENEEEAKKFYKKYKSALEEKEN